MHWGVLIFMVAFAVGLVFLSTYYLIPALRAYAEARKAGDQTGTKAIAATSALLLAVILFVLFTSIALTFRVARFFFPRPAAPRTRTQYTDAWAESARRMQTPPPDDGPDGPADR